MAGVTVTLGGRRVLDGLTWSAAAGEITALLGPNGAGKTTTIRCITGLLTPDAGTIRVLDGAPGGTDDRVGLMPQSVGAWSAVRPGELLRYLAGLYPRPVPIDDLVEALELGPLLNRPYRRLSGGEQQAVNLAGALIGRPELVLLDEPTAGMDPRARRRTWGVIDTLRADGVSVLLTTHDMAEAARLADRVWIMDAGRVTVSGTVAELTAEASLEDVFLRHTGGAG
ncbi:ABC transporter ATP-binding protein [Micropruina sp. KQZ13P-5]|nr:ABC transporter ATP-binding protein [Micropruina sp. KQZ13P-5]MCW3157195.1 ABC transporter ATP-binding protein [Micropruina sp. KQZ13P-5]